MTSACYSRQYREKNTLGRVVPRHDAMREVTDIMEKQELDPTDKRAYV